MRSSCPSAGGCTFGLTDRDIAEVATTLPNLVDVSYRHVCPANSCRTNVSSLLFISTRCKYLTHLETHFNTTNLRDDLESTVESPRLRDSYALPECRLTNLSVSHAPLPIEEGTTAGCLQDSATFSHGSAGSPGNPLIGTNSTPDCGDEERTSWVLCARYVRGTLIPFLSIFPKPLLPSCYRYNHVERMSGKQGSPTTWSRWIRDVVTENGSSSKR